MQDATAKDMLAALDGAGITVEDEDMAVSQLREVFGLPLILRDNDTTALFFQGRAIVDPGNESHPAVTYTPFVTMDGRVGYAARRTIERWEPATGTDGEHLVGDVQETFVYLNPSDTRDDATANVFLYTGPRNNPAYDSSECFIAFDDAAFASQP